MSTYRFSFPTPIHFGPGVRAQLADFLKSNGVKRPLIVTDKGVAQLPMHAEMLEALNGAGLKAASFSGVWGNPVKSQVTEGVKAFKSHEADGIVGLGGGAALDVAKAIALMATHPGDLFDYEDEKPGARPIDGPIPFWVAVPTTSGTGSEVGRSSVVSDDQTHIKKIIFSPKLLAKAVFADPELTIELPAPVTAATGMDALTHCVEAYLAKGYHPICDGIALEGLRQASQYLVRAREEPARPRSSRRHDDVLDDGRDRVPEGPGRDPFLRARARHGGGHAPRPRQRHHDRPRAQAQRDGRARAVQDDGRDDRA